jgi:GNAT superfamily N-acetyltransferase
VSAVEIIRPEEAELHELFGLAKRVFAGVPGWSDCRVLETLQQDVVFVAHAKRRAAGYVALHPEADAVILIDHVLVAPGHEGRGIGHRLLAHAEGYAIAEGATRLEIVEEDNRPARSFYHRSGSVPVSAELFELVLPGAG